MVSKIVMWVSRQSSVEVIALDKMGFHDGSDTDETYIGTEDDEQCDGSVVGLIDQYEPKLVRFTDPLVTASRVVPRLEGSDVKNMFYSSVDIARFRKQHRTQYGDAKKYDRVFCEQLVEDLDKMGATCFAAGQLGRALEAFKHSLRVRTETNVDFTHQSTANIIHCIADVYSKQRNWSQALHAYSAALQALEYNPGKKDSEATKVAIKLQRKAAMVQRHMGRQDTPSQRLSL